MAKIFFVGLDGAEKSYRLQTHRPFTLGRDPGNDIILRDPKVSRHHAEIVFERGFFVLHDLASANGTYVNAKRIRVAPLTHGARLRMGNTYGRFSEELPTENDAAPLAAAPDEARGQSPDGAYGQPYDPPGPPTEDLGALEMLPTATLERVNLQTVPHDKVEPAELKKK